MHKNIFGMVLHSDKYLASYLQKCILALMESVSSFFWNITRCSPLKSNYCFRGICHFHLQGQRIRQTSNQHESDECWSQYIPLKCWQTFNGLHGNISQKTKFVITTAMSGSSNR
jgi:hypothetical protein